VLLPLFSRSFSRALLLAAATILAHRNRSSLSLSTAPQNYIQPTPHTHNQHTPNAASLTKMMPAKCTVVRDGAENSVDAADLVPGDLIRLSIGDRIPADARIVQSYGLKVEASSLTGESDLIPATVESASSEALESHCIVFGGSLVMQGSGRAVVIRTGDKSMIGRIAALASGGGGGEGNEGGGKVKTTLDVEIDRLLIFVGIIAVVVPITFFAIGAARQRLTPLQAFVNGFVVAVIACVLQGMRATVLSLLALCSQKLRERNVLLKRTDTIETLGSATVICSDKTGTLTQNVMTVQSVWVGGQGPERHVADEASAALTGGGAGAGAGGLSKGMAALSALPAAAGAAAAGASRYAWDNQSTLAKLVVVATVCNKAQFAGEVAAAAGGEGDHVAVPLFSGVPGEDPAPAGGKDKGVKDKAEGELLGDATDCGLLRFADRSMPSAQVRAAYKKIYERPFNSTDKFSLAVAQLPPSGGGGGSKPGAAPPPPRYLLFLKGAPEIVRAKCGAFHSAATGASQPLPDAGFEREMTAAYRSAGGAGERVIGFSYAPLELPAAAVAAAAAMADPADAADALREAAGAAVDALVASKALSFLGLVSLMDPPRPGVLEAVQTW
jgi:magnesium-transporting ATPase (P-type)